MYTVYTKYIRIRLTVPYGVEGNLVYFFTIQYGVEGNLSDHSTAARLAPPPTTRSYLLSNPTIPAPTTHVPIPRCSSHRRQRAYLSRTTVAAAAESPFLLAVKPHGPHVDDPRTFHALHRTVFCTLRLRSSPRQPTSPPPDPEPYADANIYVRLIHPSPPPPRPPCMVGLLAEGEPRESLAGCPHRNWARDHLAVPVCRAEIKCVHLVERSFLFSSHIMFPVGTLRVPPRNEIHKLTRKEQVFNMDTGERLFICRAARPPGAVSAVATHYACLPAGDPTRIYDSTPAFLAISAFLILLPSWNVFTCRWAWIIPSVPGNVVTPSVRHENLLAKR